MAKRPAPKKPKPPHPGEHPPKPPKPKHRHHTHEELVELVIALENQIMAISAAVTAAFDAQDQKLTALSDKVDAFVAAGGSTANDAEVVARIAKQGQTVDAIAAKLTPAP